MGTNAVRGAALVAVAVLLGALVLGWGLDDPVPGLIGTTGSAASDVDFTEPSFEDDVSDDAFVDPAPLPPEPQVVLPPAPPPAPAFSPLHDASQVSVQVANAASINGLAGRFSDRLQARNFVTRTAANAETTAESVIYYEPGYDGDADLILREVFNSPNVRSELMPVPRPPVNPEDPNGSNILIIVGTDDLSLS